MDATLQAIESLPTRDCNCHLVATFLLSRKCCSFSSIDTLSSIDILAVMFSVSMTIPKNVMHVEGWKTFSGFMGVLMRWHNVNMDSKFCLHTGEFEGASSQEIIYVGNGEDIVHSNFW